MNNENNLILGNLIRTYQENPIGAKGALLLHLDDEIRKESIRLETCKSQYNRQNTQDGNVSGECSDAFVSEEARKGSVLCQQHQERLNKLQRAQYKIHHSKFGECTECGCTIAPERLAVKIETIHCFDCQDLLERETNQKTHSAYAY